MQIKVIPQFSPFILQKWPLGGNTFIAPEILGFFVANILVMDAKGELIVQQIDKMALAPAERIIVLRVLEKHIQTGEISPNHIQSLCNYAKELVAATPLLDAIDCAPATVA